MVLVLFVCLILSKPFGQCFGHTALFRLELEGHSVVLDEKTTVSTSQVKSKLTCFIQCQQNIECCFVQIQNDEKLQNHFECTLIKFLKIDAVQTKIKERSQVYGILNQPKKCVLKDCLEWFQNGFQNDGVYDIKINGQITKVFCDMISNGGGWTVFQRRIDGEVDFQRGWNEYKNGFGDAKGDYWLGNEFIHQMTSGKSNVLIKIEATDFQNLHRYIIFKGFSVESEENKYKLHTGVFEDGVKVLGENWIHHDGMFFTTKDRDNDIYDSNCAVMFAGGWWHKDCYELNPNTYFSKVEDVPDGLSLLWRNWHNTYYKTLKSFRMSIKEM